MKKLWIPETTQRDERSQWLYENAAIVVQNLNLGQYKKIHAKEIEFFDGIRLKDTEITSEHVFPNIIPTLWSKKIRSLYKKNIDTLDQATLSVYLDGDNSTNDREAVRYAAHSAISEYPSLNEKNLEDVLWQFNSINLPSPGRNYDDAAQIVRSAVIYRLRHTGDLAVTEGSIALAYLQKLGYQVLSLGEFFKIFSP